MDPAGRKAQTDEEAQAANMTPKDSVRNYSGSGPEPVVAAANPQSMLFVQADPVTPTTSAAPPQALAEENPPPAAASGGQENNESSALKSATTTKTSDFTMDHGSNKKGCMSTRRSKLILVVAVLVVIGVVVGVTVPLVTGDDGDDNSSPTPSNYTEVVLSPSLGIELP